MKGMRVIRIPFFCTVPNIRQQILLLSLDSYLISGSLYHFIYFNKFVYNNIDIPCIKNLLFLKVMFSISGINLYTIPLSSIIFLPEF